MHTADVDGDGDVDVLSASVFDSKIAWYENTDGKGNFGPQQVITTAARDAQRVIMGFNIFVAGHGAGRYSVYAWG